MPDFQLQITSFIKSLLGYKIVVVSSSGVTCERELMVKFCEKILFFESLRELTTGSFKYFVLSAGTRAVLKECNGNTQPCSRARVA